MNWISLTLLLMVSSCLPLPEESKPTSSSLFTAPGDIIVSSINNDAVYVFDSEGTYKRILWSTTRVADVINALGWMHSTNEILISVEGAAVDRVIAVSVIDGRARELINDANFVGTARGVAQLYSSRDIIASEGATMERYNENGIRESHGTIWPSNVATLANTHSIRALQDGTWIAATNASGLRLFPDQVTTFASSANAAPPTGTTITYGVDQTSTGQFIASWEGGSEDYLSLYNSDLSFNRHIIGNDQGLLTAPRGVAVKKNGNFLVADQTRQYIIEVTPAGSVVKLIGQGFLNSPYALIVVPDFSP